VLDTTEPTLLETAALHRIAPCISTTLRAATGAAVLGVSLKIRRALLGTPTAIAASVCNFIIDQTPG